MPKPTSAAPLREEEQIEFYERNLVIDPDALDEALLLQPTAFYAVARQLSLLTSRRDAAKQDLAVVEATADADFRDDAAKRGDKITEREIESLKKRDGKVIEATRDLHILNQRVGEIGALKEAFGQRGYVLKDLVALHLAQYYGDPAHSSAGSSMKTAVANSTRKKMNQARREA